MTFLGTSSQHLHEVIEMQSTRSLYTLFAFALFVAGLNSGCSSEDDGEPQAVLAPVVDGNARFSVLTPSLIRLEHAAGGVFEDRPSQLVGVRPTLSATFESRIEGELLVIETDALTLEYKRGSGPFSPDNLSITFVSGDQPVTVGPTWGPLTADSDSLGGWLRGLDLDSGRKSLRPGLLTRRGWRLLDDSDTALLVGEAPGYTARPERTDAYQDGYFFGYGMDYRQALADLRHLTGAAPLLPRNALGVWFSRYYAYSQEEWRGVVEDFQTRDVPLDVLSLDTDWKRPAPNNFCQAANSVSGARLDDPCSWNGWDWNFDIFPDPADFMAWAHAEGIDVGLNIHPSINAGDPEYAQIESAGVDLMNDISDLSCQFLQSDLANECLVFDLLDQAEINAYFALHDPIAEVGIDFWWFDWCCEQTGQYAPGLTADTWINQLYYQEHRALGSRWPAFSRMGGALGSPPDEANLLGAFAEHRQTLHFTGDTCSTWELLEFVGEFTVAEGSVGMPYVSHDIGSFHGELIGDVSCSIGNSNPRMSDEMYIRWIQFGTFQPLNRLHSNHGDRLPWEYPGKAEVITTEFLRLRGRLVPHLYTLSYEAHASGLPMTRALYLQWPADDDAYEFPAQFTLGDDLLVATVAAPGENPSVDMWIPPGTWYPYFSGSAVTGPQVLAVEVPLDEYAVFARAGSILPTQQDLPTSSRGPQDNLTLTVWAGGDGSYTLYEDEGVGFEYEQGVFQTTVIDNVDDGEGCQVVTIGAAEGSEFPGALTSRSWTVELVGFGDAEEVRLNADLLSSGGSAPGWVYDATSNRVRVQTGVVETDKALKLSFGAGCD